MYFTQHYTYALHRSKCDLNYVCGLYGGYTEFRSQLVV